MIYARKCPKALLEYNPSKPWSKVSKKYMKANEVSRVTRSGKNLV